MKSHVSMEQHVCMVCGAHYDTGAILLDKRLLNSLDRNTLTGMGLCPEHQKLHDDGFVALVEVDPSKSTASTDGTIKPEDAYRTGTVTHLKREAAAKVFTGFTYTGPMMFVEPEVTQHLQRLAALSQQQ